MRLFLHIGTEKTGSSFLQTLLALNRDQLKQSKIDYPSGGNRENDMLSGKISPGNGKELYLSIKEGAKEKVKLLLNKFKKEANKQNCDTILISNENLIEVFSKANFLNAFLDVCTEVNLDIAGMLLILRNPVDQALSLYKHRSKNGKAPELSNWIENSYDLPAILNDFFENVKNNEILFTVRKYQSDTGSMQNIMFKDWLNIDAPKVEVDKRVNPSLTISELSLLKNLGQKNINFVKPFYNKMLNIAYLDKDKDEVLSEYYKNLISKRLTSFEDVWTICNTFLGEKEKLTLPSYENMNQEDKIALSFSNIQVDAIVDFFLEIQNEKLGRNKLIKKIKVRLYNFLKK